MMWRCDEAELLLPPEVDYFTITTLPENVYILINSVSLGRLHSRSTG